MSKMLPGYFAAVTEIMQPLNDTERKQLVRLLQKIQGGLSADQTADQLEPALSSR